MKFFTFVDIENSFHARNNKNDPSPYNIKNRLVSIGYCASKLEESGHLVDADSGYLFFNHTKLECDQPSVFTRFQSILDQTQLLVAHNAKHDLSWLLETGFKYDGAVYCTMIGEYVLQRGVKKPLSLEELLKEKGLPQKRVDLIAELLKQGENFDTIDPNIIREYGEADILGSKNLFLYQLKDYGKNENKCLIKTRDMMNEYLQVLTEIERNGIALDHEELDKIGKEFAAEQEDLLKKFKLFCHEVMGDLEINPDSPEQLSWVIYSRKVLDKVDWVRTFNIGTELVNGARKPKRRIKYNARDFVNAVRTKTTIWSRARRNICETCSGAGKQFRLTKSGVPFSRQPKCSTCGGSGIRLISTGETAGFKYSPRGTDWVCDGGFATDRETLQYIELDTKNAKLREFVQLVQRLNVLSTWLETFVKGIKDAQYPDGLLHTSYMQCVTATGRVSSRNPNLTNQPRSGTFPVRRTFVSRWKDGQLLESDAKGLEYRTAVDLADDPVGKSDIENKVDPHAFTATNIYGVVTKDTRQNAKPHTFAPLYGASPSGKPEAVARYYTAFMEKHQGIKRLHRAWENIVLITKKIRIPSGREYHFPWVRRLWNGAVSQSTKWKNYPVQGFATADIVPVAGIALWKKFKEIKSKSKLVLTVHDNFIVDIHPSELDTIPQIVCETLSKTREFIKERYDYNFKVALEWETKIGSNLIAMKEYVPHS